MTDRESFIAAIKADPDNDSPRLIYADWLDEHGEPDRAEFIRVQCDLVNRGFPEPITLRIARLATMGIDAGVGPEAFRACQLLYQHAAEWFDDRMFADSIQVIDEGADWRRGFVEQITCAAEDWIEHADAILAEHPIRRVTFIRPPAVFHSKGWDGIEFVILRNGFPSATIENGESYFDLVLLHNERTEQMTVERWEGISARLATGYPNRAELFTRLADPEFPPAP